MKKLLSVFLILLSSVSCHNGFQAIAPEEFLNQAQETPPLPTDESSLGGICSKLNFTGVTWPSTMASSARKSFALGLNITGSFEGHTNWNNIANNFDGQGMSLGLLQQNFGQGSLQPLLIKMFENHGSELRSLFTSADLGSLQTMLSEWNSNPVVIGPQDNELFPDKDVLSPLDRGSEGQQLNVFLTPENAKSVAWAVDSLYLADGKTFVTRWKNSFVNMTSLASYRSIQLEAAQKIYNKAVGYFRSFGFTELRMLLMMFDYVTQNGGFNADHKSQYDDYISTHPKASETEKALALLEIRLQSVLDQYVEDVRARKQTVITGKGTVHGSSRDLQTEYCYSSTEKIQ
jgi:hypothetical protein